MNTENQKKNIGVFFGSGSVEHDVSIITAQLIIAGLKGLGYPVTPVYITKTGRWLIGADLGNLKLFTDPNKKLNESKYQGYYLDVEQSVGKMVFRRKGLLSRSITIDLAFPALHGTFGEDGKIQGLFEMLGVPYVGCDVTSSAVAMDKVLTKQLYQQHQIPTTKFVYFERNNWNLDKSKILNQINQKLTWPVFVKPARLGSSIGIAKVKEAKDLEQKIEVALFYDSKVLVEEAVEPVMDVTCCVIGNDEPRPSLLQESVFAAELFDFEEKYLKAGGSQLGKSAGGVVIPARLDEQTTKNIQEMAVLIYKAFGCSGIARVDFLYNKTTKEFFANEINPMPGTLYHHLWKASGLELDQLLQSLIMFAREKYEEKRKVNYTFESSLLKNLGGAKLKKNYRSTDERESTDVYR